MILKRKNLLLICIFNLLRISIFPAAPAAPEGTNAVERYALYVASSRGGPGSEVLRYAGSDAEKMCETMTEIGGVKRQNSLILKNPSRKEVENAFTGITAQIRKTGSTAKRVEFLFYYSGHSDENALLLGSESYDYSSLKAAISAVQSDIHVVILDSCFSGNFIRAKGGLRQKPFLLDDSSIVQGHAYLSSSSEKESSQESDAIGASYFTSSVITGLRGAADTSGDNKVSLNELYDYAFNNTLSQTELSTIGPQHPSYNITLVGSGDLVLTDISEADSVLFLPEQTSGKFIIRSSEGRLVSEVNKTTGNKMDLALPAGEYIITVVTPTTTKQTTIQLRQGNTYRFDPSGLHQVPLRSGTAMGPSESDEQAITFQPFCLSFVSGVQYPPDAQNVNISAGLLTASQERISGVQATLVYGHIGKDFKGVQASALINKLTAEGQGIQGAGFMNIDTASLKGAQGSGFMNIAYSDLKGAQGTGFMNILRGNGLGVQGSGFMNIASGQFKGVQGTGFLNIMNGNGTGIQGSGFMNIATKDFYGVQGTGFLNITRGNGTGIQGAGFMNIASGQFKGIQGAAFMNIAQKIDGAQIGIVNIAKENNGVAIGLLNIIGNGIISPAVYAEQGNVFVEYQGGTNIFFATLLAGIPASYNEYAVLGTGIGTRFWKKAFSVDLELLYKQIIEENSDDEDFHNENNYPSARISANYMFFKHFGVFVACNADLKADGWNERAFTYWDHGTPIRFTCNTADCTVYTSCSVGIRF